MPYSYWRGTKRAELTVDLNGMYRLSRVRFCVLNKGPHGIDRIELFKRGDPLEFPEALKLGERHAENGWNEFADLDTVSDGIRVRFTGRAGTSYITVSEIEVWGDAAPGKTVPSLPRRTRGKSIVEGDLTWYAYDFGPPASPVFGPFTGVGKDTGYSPERGYGFLAYHNGEPGTPSNFGPESVVVPGLGDRDRADKGASLVDSLYRDFVMTSQYYHTQVRQSFVIDVPNGIYRIITFHGDIQYGKTGPQNWWIEAEGRRVVENLDMPSTHRADAVFDATVADGQLTIAFDAAAPDPASCGFVVNGLAAFPAGTDTEKAAAVKKIEQIRAALQRERDELFADTFVEKPHVEDADPPEPSDEDKRRGFVPFVPHWLATVYPNSVPRPTDFTRPLAAFACPGEFEPLTVALRTLRDLEGVRCTVSSLTGPETLPADIVEVRTVTCWPQRIGSSWGTEWQVMPELLERKPEVDVKADTTQEFWLTVHVPETAAPGVYRGTVRLTSTDGGLAEIPIQLEVLPFSLLSNERPVGMYWYEHRVAGTPRRDIQIRDMLAHGVTAVTMGRLFPKIRNDDTRPVLQLEDLRIFLQELHALGIRGPIPYHTSILMRELKRAFPDADENALDALYVEAVRQLETVSSRDDTPALLYYPVDEIGNHEDRGRKAQHECELIGRVTGAVSYITVNNYEAGERWGDTFDIWCGNIEYTPEQEQALLEKGKRYMRYGPAYLNSARKARNSSGFGFYRRPAEAMYYWHYQCFQGDPFNDFDGTCRDHCAAYPGEDGTPIPTIDWEAIREGIDDMKYIATLKAYARKAAETPPARDAAQRALSVLTDVLGGDDRVNQYTFRDDLSDDDYHALRRRIVDQILLLRDALTE
jgi:hypothetical protein